MLRSTRGRPELAWGVSRFREHARDVHDPGELLALAEREIVAPLDREARRIVTRSAKRVATVTALSPMVLIAVGLRADREPAAAARACHALRRPARDCSASLKLARMVFTHIVATGGIAMTDDLLGQFLGQDLLRRLSRRLGEGAFNGALTARIGVTALEVIRPLPFLVGQTASRPRHSGGSAEAALFTPSKTGGSLKALLLERCTPDHLHLIHSVSRANTGTQLAHLRAYFASYSLLGKQKFA